MNNEILVGIHCITYNHKDYIGQCLDGFVMQKTNFKFMAFVGDDASTDGTTEIIREYEQKFPHIIKGIYHTQNVGISKNSFDVANVCKSKYIAVCEGDDYWTDENKLQKQVDFLEANPDYTLCFHPVQIIYESFNFKRRNTIHPRKKQEWNFEVLLKWNFIHTNSVVYRRIFTQSKLNEIFPSDILPGDWYSHLLYAKEGKIKMIDNVMSVYRRHPSGIWSDSIENEDKLYSEHALNISKFYHCVYENITNKSQEYLQNMLVPKFQEIVRALYRQSNFQNFQKLYELYPRYFELVFIKQNSQNSPNKFIKKYKKYKFFLKIVCFMGFVEFICILVLLLK